MGTKSKTSILCFCFVGLLNYKALFSEENELSPGMEAIKVGSAKMIVPEGTKMNQTAGVITLETTAQYVARRLLNIEKKLDTLKEKINSIEEKVNSIGEKQQKLEEELGDIQPEPEEQSENLEKQEKK